jgi:polyferredoxin
MDTNRTEQQDILKTMFNHLPEETLSQAFLPEMMQRIRKESVRIRKRDERLRIAALVAASLTIVGLTAATFIYMGVPKIEIDFSMITIPPLYLFIGAFSLILLLADSLFRQRYYKKHPERYSDSMIQKSKIQ